MDWYLILKFVHVASAILWLGGGGALVFAATISRGLVQKKNIIGTVNLLSNRLFIPALVLVLLSGSTMWWVGALAFDAWVAYGLAGILVTGTLGIAVLSLASVRIATLSAKNASPEELAPMMAKLLRGAQADIVALASVVFAMVMKPSWSDKGMLLGMVVAASAAFLLTRSEAKAA